jgi:hypothetical protein
LFPELIKIAISSASDKLSIPLESSFSLGLSSIAHDFIEDALMLF